MPSLTLNIDETTLRRARIRALERGTSVNALVREYIESFAGEGPAASGVAGFLEIAANASSGSGAEGRSWTRDDAQRS